jgi:hypothetical protein
MISVRVLRTFGSEILAFEKAKGPSFAAATSAAVDKLVERHAGARPGESSGRFTAESTSLDPERQEIFLVEWTRDLHAGVTWRVDDPSDKPADDKQADAADTAPKPRRSKT